MANDFGNSDPPDHDDTKGRRRGHLLREVVRKTLAQSLDARGVTEETLRAIVGEVKLPREIGNVLFQQADAIKNEVTRVVAGEVRSFLHDANLGEELAKILTSISFEVRTEIRFIPNDEALKPSVRSRVGVKSQKDKGEPELVETKESAVMDKAIRSSVTSLANRFLHRLDDLFEDDPDGEEEEASASPDTESDASESSNDAQPAKRNRRPDLRRRAEAVASAGRATASKAATAVTAARKPGANVTSKARTTAVSTATASRGTPKTATASARPQPVVRGHKPEAATTDAQREVEPDPAEATVPVKPTPAKPTPSEAPPEQRDEASKVAPPVSSNGETKSDEKTTNAARVPTPGEDDS